MNHLSAVSLMMVLFVLSPAVHAQDSVQKELDRAKAVYQKEKEAYRASVLESYEKREDAARKAADKKLVDQVKAELDAFEHWNAAPSSVPPAVNKRRSSSRARMESAFQSAIKNYVRMKNDEAASATEKELEEFRGEDWPHLNLEAAKITGDSFQIRKNAAVTTTTEFSGPIEISAFARTEKDEIRFAANRDSRLIFSWELNPSELRVHRPDGGSLATASVTPLKPGVWYRLRWRLTDDGMQVFINDQMIFSESKSYDLTAKSRVSLQTLNSLVEVRDFHVVSLKKE